jgi:hypothetical protein
MRRDSKTYESKGRIAGGRAVVLLTLVLAVSACGGSDPSGDVGGTDTPTTGGPAGGDPAGASDVGTIVVIIGTERFEFVTSPPRTFSFDGNQYGSCQTIAGTLRASGYTTDGSDIVATVQVTQPGATGSWVVVKDGSEFLFDEEPATVIWGANAAGLSEDDPLYHGVGEDRTVDGSGASGSAIFVDALAESPEQVAGSFEVNCND